MVSKEGKYSIICFGLVWSDDFCKRRQQIMLRLSQMDDFKNVVYVELPLTLTSLVKYLLGRADSDATRRWKRVLKHGLVYQSGKVLVVSPLSILPFIRSFETLRRANDLFTNWFRFFLIKRVISKFRLRDLITWIDIPRYPSSVSGKLGEKLSCYDTADDHWRVNEANTGRLNELIKNDEENTRRADIVFVNSENLHKKKKTMNPATFLIPNGVDFDFFQQQIQGNPQPPEDMAPIKKPIIGYILETFSENIDVELMLKIARHNPDRALVVICRMDFPLDAQKRELMGLDNVYFLGAKPYSEVPIYINCFDICASFYKVSDVNDTAMSLKLLEYLALGKPVISTNTAGAYLFSDVIHVAQDHEEFVSLIDKILQSNPDRLEVREKRLRVAKLNSWNSKIQEFRKILLQHLNSVA